MGKLLLLSGGLDSALCLNTVPDIALCVGFDYGQPHVIELEFAQKLAESCGVEFLRIELPKMFAVDDVVFAGRNAVLLATAGAVAQRRGLETVVIGCNKSDSDRFPDCRPEFIVAMNNVMSSYNVSVLAPLLYKTKTEIVTDSEQLGIRETWTCYRPDNEIPCGKCYSCLGLEAARVQG